MRAQATYRARPQEVERRWYVIDAKDIPLGRLASRVASVLRGKHKPTYTPGVDTGDFVIVLNAAAVALTGRKRERKLYYRHSQYPGGLKVVPYGKLLETKPEEVIKLAVKRMLPRTTLGRAQMRRLKVFKGGEHPHSAQKPQILALDAREQAQVEGK